MLDVNANLITKTYCGLYNEPSQTTWASWVAFFMDHVKLCANDADFVWSKPTKVRRASNTPTYPFMRAGLTGTVMECSSPGIIGLTSSTVLKS